MKGILLKFYIGKAGYKIKSFLTRMPVEILWGCLSSHDCSIWYVPMFYIVQTAQTIKSLFTYRRKAAIKAIVVFSTSLISTYLIVLSFGLWLLCHLEVFIISISLNRKHKKDAETTRIREDFNIFQTISGCM